MYDIVMEDGNKRKVRFLQPVERMDKLFGRIRRDITRGLNLPGFRPGKVPRSIIDRQYGNLIRAEVADKVRREVMSNIMDEQDWILDDNDPEMDIDLPVEGSEFSFEMTFSLFETPEPQGVKGISIKLPEVDLDKAVEDTIQSFRERMVDFSEVERPASTGDVVVLGTASGVADEEPREMNLRLGDGQLGPGFDQLCCGLSAGDSFRARMVDGEGNSPGPSHSFSVVRVLEPVLPELNDEFAEKAAGVPTVDDLRQKVLESVTERRDQELEHLKEHQAVESLLESNPFDPPKYMVDNLTSDYLHRLGEEEPGDEARKAAEEMAQRKVREFLLLRAVALKEDIVISEEDIESERSPEETASSVLDRLRNRRAMELLLAEATIEESEPPEPVTDDGSKGAGGMEHGGWTWEEAGEEDGAGSDPEAAKNDDPEEEKD